MIFYRIEVFFIDFWQSYGIIQGWPFYCMSGPQILSSSNKVAIYNIFDKKKPTVTTNCKQTNSLFYFFATLYTTHPQVSNAAVDSFRAPHLFYFICSGWKTERKPGKE